MSPELPMIAPAQRSRRGPVVIDVIFLAQVLIEFPAFLMISIFGAPLLVVAGWATVFSLFMAEIETLDVLPYALYGLLLCSGPWLAMMAYSEESRKKSRKAMVWSLVAALTTLGIAYYWHYTESQEDPSHGCWHLSPLLFLVSGACACLGLSCGIHAIRRPYVDNGHPGAASVKEPVEWPANLS